MYHTEIILPSFPGIDEFEANKGILRKYYIMRKGNVTEMI